MSHKTYHAEVIMFYDVKILNAKGKLKKTITREQLSQRHWQFFQNKHTLRKRIQTLLPDFPETTAM